MTKRQEELSQFLTSWLTENEIEGSIEFNADWCFEFFKLISIGLFVNNQDYSTQLILDLPDYKWGDDEVELWEGVWDNTVEKLYVDTSGKVFKHFCTNTGNLTQQLQEAVKQSIEWLPSESKQVIKEMK